MDRNNSVFIEFEKKDKVEKLQELEKIKRFSENEKFEQCKGNKQVKYFSEHSLKLSEKSKEGIKAMDVAQGVDASCVSFSGVYSIPLKYPWLNKEIYNLNFSNKKQGVWLDETGFSDYSKDFLVDKCIIPKSVILGAGMRAHFKKGLLEAFDFDIKNVSAEVNEVLWNSKSESKNGYNYYDTETSSFSIYEPDLLVVLGYELEDLCPQYYSKEYL